MVFRVAEGASVIVDILHAITRPVAIVGRPEVGQYEGTRRGDGCGRVDEPSARRAKTSSAESSFMPGYRGIGLAYVAVFVAAAVSSPSFATERPAAVGAVMSASCKGDTAVATFSNKDGRLGPLPDSITFNGKTVAFEGIKDVDSFAFELSGFRGDCSHKNVVGLHFATIPRKNTLHKITISLWVASDRVVKIRTTCTVFERDIPKQRPAFCDLMSSMRRVFVE
ncbi:MAG: hypothetical protein K2Q06_14960 [Parvularculaceae bacterium]|nr:hypothetical protein [Parvularculaceae bacterium]